VRPERVLVTGAAGRIGSVLREGFRGAFPVVRLTDIKEFPPAREGEEVVRADLGDLEAVLDAMRGVDVVVHLGAIPDEDTFSRLLRANVTGTYHVFEAARQLNVRRVVFASTNHVTGFYPSEQTIGPDDPIRPDSLYGVSKAFGEAVGRLYSDKFGIEVVCVRIGAFGKRPSDAHHARMWLGPRDCVQLFRKSIETPDLDFLIVYGASRVPAPFWINPNGERIGYEPEDDPGDVPVGEDAAEHLQGAAYTRRHVGSEGDAAEPGGHS
jgi:uronate dehydrogenase